jgi:CheY-like chemotaxis protein
VGRCDGADPKIQTDCQATILVVEDEVLIRMVIADGLRDAGYTVIEASNAHEALEILDHSNVDVRCVFSDLRMSGTMDGVGLARAVRAQYPAIRVVLTSGHEKTLDWTAHDGFFPKPYDPVAIIRHIKTLLD